MNRSSSRTHRYVALPAEPRRYSFRSRRSSSSRVHSPRAAVQALTFLDSSEPLAVSTRCGLTRGCTHDRLRASFTPARKQLRHQAVVSRTIASCLLPRRPRSASRRRLCCSSCETLAPIWRGWSRRSRAISSRSSWCRSRVWTPGSGESLRPGGRSAAGWPSGEFRSTGSNGDHVPGSEK